MKDPITDKHALAAHGGARLVFAEGRRAGQEMLITRETFFIGRSPNNNLVLDDRTVSRKHAVINLLNGEHVLSDLNSFRGIFVNGKQVKEAVLKHGDSIGIGTLLLYFLVEGDVSKPIRKRRTVVWLAVSAFILSVVLFLIFFSNNNEIELNYSLGIKAYNVDKDVDLARRYWQKVLELDPEKKTEYANKALILLNNLPSNSEGSESR